MYKHTKKIRTDLSLPDVTTNKKRGCIFSPSLCRDDWTRTSGLHVPNVARYQLRYISFAVANVINVSEKNTTFAEKFLK